MAIAVCGAILCHADTKYQLAKHMLQENENAIRQLEISDFYIKYQLWNVLADNRRLCDDIAKSLEIESDGGDDAGAFVQDVAWLRRDELHNIHVNTQIKELQKGIR